MPKSLVFLPVQPGCSLGIVLQGVALMPMGRGWALEGPTFPWLLVVQVHQAPAGRGSGTGKGLGLAGSQPALSPGHHQGVQVSLISTVREEEELETGALWESRGSQVLRTPRARTVGLGCGESCVFTLSPRHLEHTVASQTGTGAAGTCSTGNCFLVVPQMKPGGCYHPTWSVTHPRTACTIAASSTSSWHTGYLCPTGSLTATR